MIAAVRCGVMVGPTERLLTPEAIQELWDRAEAILGAAEFAALVSSHRNGSANLRHRLVDQLIRLDDAKSGHLRPIAETTASVSAAEVDAVLKLAEEWRTSPAWPEVRRGLRSAAEYLHSVGVLAVGSMLKVRHTAAELVVAKAADREPDLALVVTHGLPLAVEVKAPQALWQPPTRLDLAACLRMIRNALAAAGTVQGQLGPDRPGVLALAGLLMSPDTYDTLVTSFELHLSKDGQKTPHLLGLAVFNLRERVVSDAGRPSTILEQQSVLRRNPAYNGPLVIDNDWSGRWQLVPR